MTDPFYNPRISPILVTCPIDHGQFLQKELEDLGFRISSVHAGAIETSGTLADTMHLNLMLRTGHRVLFSLDTFRARTPDDLYRSITAFPWEEYIRRDGFFSVTSSADNIHIRDSRFANLKCKDAVVDRFMKKFGVRPDTGPQKKGVVIFIYWHDDRCNVFLDTSGELLSRRGYRTIPLEAPLQEGLAAAVIMATQWNMKDQFINPMCGSGTLAIEAALIAAGHAPGLTRRDFGFMHIRGFKKEMWQELTLKEKGKALFSTAQTIIASDIRARAVEAARKNAVQAGIGHLIEFHHCDFRSTPIPGAGGIIICNPGYGERMGAEESLTHLYREIGDFFKKRCQGMKGYLFTGNPRLAKHIGLRTARRIPFMNGTIPCRLLEYDLYSGSRKQLKRTGECAKRRCEIDGP